MNRSKLSKMLAFAASMVCALLAPAPAAAQDTDWPTKPIRLVVGYAAGGATDVIAVDIADGVAHRVSGTCANIL